METNLALTKNTGEELKRAVKDGDLLSRDYLLERDWSVLVIDDNGFIDEEIKLLDDASRRFGIDYYYSILTENLEKNKDRQHFPFRKYSANTDLDAWKQFYAYEHSDGYDYLDDCVFFSDPIEFMILRSGEMHTIYAGPPDFVSKASGYELDDSRAIFIGNYWPDTRVHEEYKALNKKI